MRGGPPGAAPRTFQRLQPCNIAPPPGYSCQRERTRSAGAMPGTRSPRCAAKKVPGSLERPRPWDRQAPAWLSGKYGSNRPARKNPRGQAGAWRSQRARSLGDGGSRSRGETGGVRHGSSPGKAVSPLRSATALHITDGPAKGVRGLPRHLTPDAPFFNDIPTPGRSGARDDVLFRGHCEAAALGRRGNRLSEGPGFSTSYG